MIDEMKVADDLGMALAESLRPYVVDVNRLREEYMGKIADAANDGRLGNVGLASCAGLMGELVAATRLLLGVANMEEDEIGGLP